MHGRTMRDWNTQHEKTGLENVGLKNVAPNCRTGKCGKRHVWKAKRCTSELSEFQTQTNEYCNVIQKGSIIAVQTGTHKWLSC